MIVVLFALCGLAGLAVGALCAGVWCGLALVMGFPAPTEDQIGGLVMLLGSVGTLGSAAIFVVAVLWDEWRSA